MKDVRFVFRLKKYDLIVVDEASLVVNSPPFEIIARLDNDKDTTIFGG